MSLTEIGKEGRYIVQSAGLSNTGLRRKGNEDSLSIVPSLRLFVVADGMGGHNAGEVASRQAIESIVEFLRDAQNDDPSKWPFAQVETLTLLENRLVAATRVANRDVGMLSDEHPEFHRMGTTLVAMLLDLEGTKAVIAHVGDSRGYVLRGGGLSRLTRDHSWVEENLEKGLLTPEQARDHKLGNIITRALGNQKEVEVDVRTIDIRNGDVYMLCSDGLSGMVTHKQMEDILTGHPDLEDCASQLIEAANRSGGRDNISIVLIRVLIETG